MTTKALSLILVTLGLPLLGAPAQTSQTSAQTTAPPAPPQPTSFEEFINDVKHPVDWLSWGGDFRTRDEYFNGILSLTTQPPRVGRNLDEQNAIRFRGRLWATATIVTNLTINGRISAESREWTKPSYAGPFRNREGMEWRYGIADNLNIKWNNILDQPFSITAGRQDILLGDYYDWWLVADGTPGDGSWTFFLDSIRMTYDAKDLKTKFDLIGIYQNSEPNDPLPTIGNSSAYYLTEQDEQGVIVYGSNKSVKNTQIDGYFIYKHDNQVRANGDNASIYTCGSKITGTPADHWQYSVEGAYQFGQKQDPTVRIPEPERGWRTLSAYGGKAKLTYLFKDSLNNQVSLLGEFLSGDDPNTAGQDEMFDLLWGRWPRWSELYIYSYVNETGGKIAQINNLGRFGASWSLNPVKKLTVSAVYNAMFAPESTPTRNLDNTLFTDTGNFRGHYVQAILRYQFSSHVTAHLWGEFVSQGNYYTSRDWLTFLRAEVLLSF